MKSKELYRLKEMVYASLGCDDSKFELRFSLSCVMMCEQLKLQLSGLEIYYAD